MNNRVFSLGAFSLVLGLSAFLGSQTSATLSYIDANTNTMEMASLSYRHAKVLGVVSNVALNPFSVIAPVIPVNLQNKCSSDGTQITLSWDPISGATYLFRLNDSTDDAFATIDNWYNAGTTDVIANYINQNSYTSAVLPGHWYSWWVHSITSAGTSQAAGGGFSCTAAVSISPSATSAPASSAAQSSAQTNKATPTQFFFYLTDYGSGPWTGPVLNNALSFYGLGSTVLKDSSGKSVAEIPEWDYTYYKISPGTQVGDGITRDNLDCYGNYSGCYTAGPASKQEAADRLHSYFVDHLPDTTGKSLLSITGHYLFQHYGAAWGADIIMSEVGENIGHTQASIAFTRGASQQYGKEWGMDWSSWYGPSIRDYSAKKVWGDNSCATCGHSDSLMERTLYASYMSGAQFFHDEAGSVNYFNGEQVGANGLLSLSSTGKVAESFLAFTNSGIDRGTPYVPVAVLLEKNHGIGLGYWYQNKPWDYLAMDSGDYATSALFDQVLWPNSFRPMNFSDESQYEVNTPYGFGDVSDVLLEDAGSNVLNKYKIIVVSGSVNADSGLIARLQSFIQNGGSIIVQGSVPSQQNIYNALSNTGKVYKAQTAQDVATMLASLYVAQAPLIVSGDVEYLINKTADGFIVTLINNKGITKAPKSLEAVNSALNQNSVVTLNSGQIGSLLSLKGPMPAQRNSTSFNVSVPAGGVTMVKISLQQTSPIPTPTPTPVLIPTPNPVPTPVLTPTITPTPTPTTGFGIIGGLKVLASNIFSRPTPPSGETVTLDGLSPVASNPYFYNNVPSGSHIVSVTVPIGWSVGYTLCYNRQDCHTNTPTPGNSVTVNVPVSGYADLWWHFTPQATANPTPTPQPTPTPTITPTPTPTPTQSTGFGSVQGFKVMANNVFNRPNPPSGETVKLDGLSALSINPYYYNNISSGSHTVSVTAPSGWSVGYTLCYNRTDCHTGTPIPGNSVVVNIPASGYADLWWHYTAP